jgi:hypothetical protein
MILCVTLAKDKQTGCVNMRLEMSNFVGIVMISSSHYYLHQQKLQVDGEIQVAASTVLWEDTSITQWKKKSISEPMDLSQHQTLVEFLLLMEL